MSLSESIKTLLVDFALLCAFLSPWIVPYCVWRFLRDLRRIAVALEARNVHPIDVAHLKFLEADEKRQREAGRVANSAFGR